MLTEEEFRDYEAAYQRGYKHAMERLGDGALELRKRTATANEHKQFIELAKWLDNCHREGFNLRAPGVRDNLFRLSDYLSGRLPVPDYEILLFLHAYIFALEHETSRRAIRVQRERRERLQKRKTKRLMPR